MTRAAPETRCAVPLRPILLFAGRVKVAMSIPVACGVLAAVGALSSVVAARGKMVFAYFWLAALVQSAKATAALALGRPALWRTNPITNAANCILAAAPVITASACPCASNPATANDPDSTMSS